MAEAVKWYLKAKDELDSRSAYNLGRCYALGEGVAKNKKEAAIWYFQAARQGHAEAQYYLGVCFVKGEGITKDDWQAVAWFDKAAEQGVEKAQLELAYLFSEGIGLPKNIVEAVKCYRLAADQGHAQAQFNLAVCYNYGRGVAKDETAAVQWYRKAADQGIVEAQCNLGVCYFYGRGVARDETAAVQWYRKAADQGNATAQCNLGVCYANGDGVIKDPVEAYKWALLAGAQGVEIAKEDIDLLEKRISASQQSEGQRRAREFKPLGARVSNNADSKEAIANPDPKSSGTGFFITDDGYFITNQHVAGEGTMVKLVASNGLIAATVVKVDKANDLSLLKAEGSFSALPIITSKGIRLGATAMTVGFPNIQLQGFAPKLAKGEIASLAGARDDARHFQISAPIQPGNSGGALVDERGNVIGVVAARLSQKAALATSGALAENVNYAVKSSYLMSFLESVPEVAAKLKEPTIQTRKLEDVVRVVEQASVMVLVY